MSFFKKETTQLTVEFALKWAYLNAVWLWTCDEVNGGIKLKT